MTVAGFRDWYVLQDVQTRLETTGEFDNVYLPSLPEEVGFAAADAKAAVVAPMDWEEIDEYDDETDIDDTVKIRIALTLMVRDDDPETRDGELDRLLNVCKNTLNSQALANGQCIPGWTKLRKGRWEKPRAPERRMTVTLETAYWVDGEADHDTSPSN